MLLKVLLLSLFMPSRSHLINKKELARQYADYTTIYKKQYTVNGFDNFVTNLQRIEDYNKKYGNCRMYLSKYSDETTDDEFLIKKCR